MVSCNVYIPSNPQSFFFLLKKKMNIQLNTCVNYVHVSLLIFLMCTVTFSAYVVILVFIVYHIN